MEEAFQKYLDSYLEICPELTVEELDFIRINLTLSIVNKKDLYLRAGDLQKAMGFVYSGLLKSYYIDENGKKNTISFIRENSYASDYPSFIQQEKSKYYIQALEPTIIVSLPYVKIIEAYEKFKNFEKYGRLVAEQILIKKQERIESFIFETAEMRYMCFIEQNPDLLNRISLTDLSSHLGIERQSLSRIRKKMLKK